MMEMQFTSDEAIAHPTTSLMAKQRLKVVRDDLFGQLDAVSVTRLTVERLLADA